MSRTLLGVLFVLVIAAAVAGGMYLERTGTAERGLQQALDQLGSLGVPGVGSGPTETPSAPSSPTPTSDTEGAGTATPTEPSPSPTGPDVVQAEGPLAAPAGSAFYWGVHQPDIPYDLASLEELATDLGEEPAIVMWYQEWAGSPSFPADAAGDVVERGAVPMVTWEAWSPPGTDPSLEPEDVRERSEQPEFRLSRIVDGEYDDYVERYAREIAEFGGPVMLRPFHEMNGFWYPWGGTVNGNEPSDLVAAWDHLHTVFAEAGADNVTWVWSVNHLSLPAESRNMVDAYWPGEDQVDWIGISGFNFGDTSSVSSWQSFERIYGDVLADLKTYDRPIVLTEFATVPSGGDEAAWIEDAFAQVQGSEQIGGLVWFDRAVEDVRDFRIGATERSERAFREAIRDVGALGASAALRAVTSQR